MSDSQRPQVGLVVVDLDDTLWTWFDAWHAGFSALLVKLSEMTELSEDALVPAIKAVHEKRGTAEYSWLLEDLEILKPFLNGRRASEAFDEALHAQNSARKHHTELYPGVAATLNYIKSCGVTVVAYTESLAFWTEWRIRRTGLDGIIDVLYSSPDHDFPAGETAETVRTLPDEDYGLKTTLHEHVARGISKPDPRILRAIVERHAKLGKETIYVGDSLDRDVEMAQSVNIIDVHAKYGETFNRPGYDLLRRVTHWKPEAVEKEKTDDPHVKAKAAYVLDEGFYQLLEFFDFAEPVRVDQYMEVWKTAVGVQMHFNDIGWRIRGLALTVLTFSLAAIGFVYVNSDAVHAGEFAFSPAAFVPVLGAGLWAAFWFADRGWFHKLLIGSVKEGAKVEKTLTANGVHVSLGANISDESPIRFYRHQSKAERLSGVAVVPRQFRGKNVEWHSSWKLTFFYLIGFVLLALSLGAIVALGPRPTANTAPAQVHNSVNVHVSVPRELPSPTTTKISNGK